MLLRIQHPTYHLNQQPHIRLHDSQRSLYGLRHSAPTPTKAVDYLLLCNYPSILIEEGVCQKITPARITVLPRLVCFIEFGVIGGEHGFICLRDAIY